MRNLANPAIWYGASATLAATLAIAPIALKWNATATAWAFGVSALPLAATRLFSEKVDNQLTMLHVGNHIDTVKTLLPEIIEINLLNAEAAGTADELRFGKPIEQQIGNFLLPAAPQMGQLPAAVEPTDFFPVEDLAALMAAAAINKKDCGSVIIACPKGTGKSNLLRAAIAKTHELTSGNVDFSVLNGKEDLDDDGNVISTYCGLEKSKDDYWHCGDGMAVPETASRLETITQVMERRKGGCPMVTILDEYNNILLYAEIYDDYLRFKGSKGRGKEESLPADPLLKPQLALNTILRGTKGRSRLVTDWITSHSPFVQDLEINTALQESWSFVVLGRGDKLDSIHSALKGSRSIVKNEKARKALSDRFTEWECAGLNTGDRVVALTNFGGCWRLVYLPQYPDNQSEIKRGAMNQSSEEIFDGELLDLPPTPPPFGSVNAVDSSAQSPPSEGDMRKNLDALFKKPASVNLPEHLGIILAAAKSKNGTISAREVQRLSGIANRYSADEVKGFLQALKESGWGDIQVDKADSRRVIFWLYSDRAADLADS